MEYLYGLLDLSFWGYVLAAFIMIQITMMSVRCNDAIVCNTSHLVNRNA